MKLSADYHTHSRHSRFFHGKNNIMEMAFKANELGLREFAITDHAFKHLFRTNKDKLYDARLTIDDLNRMSKTKILLGIEADILDENGTLDVDTETLALVDVLIAGYHRMIKTDFASFFGKQANTPEAKQKATNAYLNAIDKYPVSIITHLDSVLTTDLYQIGKACAEKGVLVEINNRHTNWTQEQMDELLASGCNFVLSSDAHCAEDVGNVQHAFDIMLKYNIPTERIINVDFELDEMTEEHKQLSRLYEEYQRKQENIETKQREEHEQKEFSTIKLSKEMEYALAQIELEQRGVYTRPHQEESSAEDESAESAAETNGATDGETAENNARQEETSEVESADTLAAQTENNKGDVERFLNEFSSFTRMQSATSAGAEAESAEQTEPMELEETEPAEVEQAQDEPPMAEKQPEEKSTSNAAKSKGGLRNGKAEITLNSKTKPAAKVEKSNPDEVKNLFSVNVETAHAPKQKEESKEVKSAKTSAQSKRGSGAFVNISSLTGEEDGEN